MTFARHWICSLQVNGYFLILVNDLRSRSSVVVATISVEEGRARGLQEGGIRGADDAAQRTTWTRGVV